MTTAQSTEPHRPQPGSARRRITREDVMTAGEVAHVLALPKSTVYELARRGELPCARLGRAVRFLRDDIEAALREKPLSRRAGRRPATDR